MTDEPQVTLAAIAGAHGVTGEVRLKLFAEGIESLRRHKQVRVGGRMLTLSALKSASMPVARFAEISDRNAAEALRGELVTVPRSALPPLGEGEYYHADLIGLPCESREGEALGRVAAVEKFAAGAIVEIEQPDGRTTMVPFKPGIADLEDGRLVVDPLFLA